MTTEIIDAFADALFVTAVIGCFVFMALYSQAKNESDVLKKELIEKGIATYTVSLEGRVQLKILERSKE